MKNRKLLTNREMETVPCRRAGVVLAALLMALALPSHAVIADPDAKSDTKEAVQTEPERVIVARVNGQPIYRDQLEKRIRNSMRQVRGFGFSKKEQALVTRASLERALDEEIAAELFYQEGKKLEIPDAAERIAKEVARIKASLTDEQKKKISDDDIQEYAERRFYIHQYMAFKDLINPQVPEEEVRAYYERTKQGYVSKETAVSVRHILVSLGKDASEEERKQAREKIEQARALLREGKDFVEVVKQFSEDASAYSGGLLGYIKPGYMPPEFDQVAFSLKPGEISDIVETKYGYHLLKVLDIRPKGTIKSYESLRDFFARYLSDELKIRKAPAHAKELREQANIEFFTLDEQKAVAPPISEPNA